MKPYILLDAGGTLVFPDVEWLSELMKMHDIEVDKESILKRVYEIDYLIDKSIRDRITLLNGNLLESLFEAFTNSKKKVKLLIDKTNERDKIKNLWAYTFEWVKKVLEDLKNQGYSMSVISNSDGRALQVLEEVELSKFMDKVYDSQIVGIEKPDAGIFRLALKEIGVLPEEVIFFGDMFYTDILGANNAGIRAVHLDPFEFYKNWPGKRIKNVSFIPEVLKNWQVSSKEFFPFIYELNEK